MPPRKPATAQANAHELMQAMGVLLRRVRGEAVGREGPRWSQAAAMARLDQAGPMMTAELARAERVKPQSMGALLAELEPDGLVRREPHPTDGRRILFSLTEAGLQERRRRQAARLAWLTAAIGRLDAGQQRTLVAAIELVKRLGES